MMRPDKPGFWKIRIYGIRGGEFDNEVVKVHRIEPDGCIDFLRIGDSELFMEDEFVRIKWISPIDFAGDIER